MNRFIVISLATALGAAVFAGSAQAAMIRPAAGGGTTTGSASMLNIAFNRAGSTDQTIRNWKGDRFDVVPVAALDDTGLKAGIRIDSQTEPHRVARLQSAIEHNRALASRLKNENVEIGNIVAAKTAMDGGITFYVR